MDLEGQVTVGDDAGFEGAAYEYTWLYNVWTHVLTVTTSLEQPRVKLYLSHLNDHAYFPQPCAALRTHESCQDLSTFNCNFPNSRPSTPSKHDLAFMSLCSDTCHGPPR